MNILCATDLLPKSDAAVERAHQMRKLTGGRPTFLHVVPPGDAHEAHVRAAHVERAVQAGPACATRDGARRAGRALRTPRGRVARSSPPRAARDLVIVGPHVVDAVGDALRGTTIERLIGEVRCPVLIVRRRRATPIATSCSRSTNPRPSGHIVVRSPSRWFRRAMRSWSLVHAHEPPYEALATTAAEWAISAWRVIPLESMSQAAAMIPRTAGQHSREPGGAITWC